MESESATTHFSNKCLILGELWLNYRDDEDFADFITYNDLGLPLAYALANAIVSETALTSKFIDETFGLLLESLGIEDTGFDSLDDVLSTD